MRFRWSAPAALFALSALLAVAFTAAAGAGTAPAQEVARQDAGLGTAHDLAGPLTKEFEARREAALEMKLRGEARGKVARLGKNKYVELVREKTDPVFVIIAEFGNTRHASFCDAVDTNPAPPNPCAFPSDGSPQRYDGPLHNAIDPPNRAIDNSTLWQSDYNPAHYKNMYFNRMAEYFEQQSSNRYSVVGDVNGWVKVPFNEARYGRDFCGGIVCNNTWFLIRDAMAFWVKGQLDAGKTTAEIATYLKTFDKWDRYDLDGDGNFDEPDGFIDHFQIVHAGGDQAAGDPHQGTDAIWSHRWYASVQGWRPRWPAGRQRRRLRADGGTLEYDVRVGRYCRDHPEQPDRRLGRRLHDPAGERRPRRVRARVLARPRSAGSLRHLGQHRRCRELDCLLDAHELRRQHR